MNEFDRITDLEGELSSAKEDLKYGVEMMVIRGRMQIVVDEIAKESKEDGDSEEMQKEKEEEATGYLKETGEYMAKVEFLKKRVADIKTYIKTKGSN